MTSLLTLWHRIKKPVLYIILIAWGAQLGLMAYNHLAYPPGNVGRCYQGITLGPGQSCSMFIELKEQPERERDTY